MVVAARRLALHFGKHHRSVGQIALTGKSSVDFRAIMDIEDIDKMYKPLLNMVGGRKQLAEIGYGADSSDKFIEAGKLPATRRAGTRCQTCTNCGRCSRAAQMVEAALG